MAQVFFASDSDPKMQAAYEKARATFRYFWREMAWERRRIVPALDMAVVKVPFQDPPGTKYDSKVPEAEQMWLSDVDFDGKAITGTLINSPNWLKSISEGDEARVPLKGITDWMYAIGGRAYGGFTVNAMRAAMGRSECAKHDAAWGLDFGDPNSIQLVQSGQPQAKSTGGFLSKWFGGSKATPTAPAPVDLNAEHPMALNMAESLEEFVTQDPSNVNARDDRGWTYLHQLALAGTKTGVEIMLKHGADINAVTSHGLTALQLAQSLDWKEVAAFLNAQGAK